MLQSGALAIAKGVARALAVRATSGGAHVALISFGGRHARTEVISSSRSRELERAIGELGAGGGTPLRHAVLTALAVCKRPAYGSVDVDKRLSILTDGRTREDLTDLRRRCLGLELGVIDCERGAVRLGRARRLALALGARYVHVESFAAGTGPGGNPSARLDPGP
jgi:Mg-chelatase subunit ChlD